MTLIQWLKDRWQSEAVHNTYFRIPDANVKTQDGGALTPTPVKAYEQYYKITLAEMFLRYRREWGASWYPTVIVSIDLKFGDKAQQIAHVAGQTTLKDFKITDSNCVALNHTVTTVLPFNGGEIEMEAALLAMQGKSDVTGLIKVLANFSKLLVVPQLSAALNVAQPLADGVAELVGATDAHPVLRIHDKWGGEGGVDTNILRAGYFVALSAEEGEVPKQELFVREGRLYRGDDPMTGYDYMLFRVDVNSTRDDGDSLASISQPYQEAIDLLENSIKADSPETQKAMKGEAEKRFASARVAVFRAPELTRIVGKNQVMDALDRQWKQAKEQLGQGVASLAVARTLQDAMRKPLSFDRALDRGELREEDFWQP